ncbi:2-amino-4-hydroxy-6-hydroxymethyldihydropteridinediphosphokinase [Roseateles sp. YR242]|uniref:2-amino-4-hydroxy-6- hydroxymethyldihydropteridine diphosphokinase n=1 Tax=Roseateles sp. YR242 TaxID=1855305 RepID=UPI0008D626B3|nr:2-amino-4-hydroxy-6-hydroxymethyldihydropteridine diphosphokinase [Roseateles sp. YR242]SEK37432.1 2-amino-4-hydroxy-6-hydroxymethyldihydropteridinediphosphokinase [Roseateles sp. YR242]
MSQPLLQGDGQGDGPASRQAGLQVGPQIGPHVDHHAFVALGANLGDLRDALQTALADLSAWPGIRVTAVSSAWHSAPVGCEGPDFLNAVAAVATSLAPQALLDALLAIEQRHGRERPFRHAPRTLDLDLLLYEDQQLHTDRLTLPHPRLHQRAFVVLPLLELAPDLLLPGLGPLRQYQAGVLDQAITREAAPLHFAPRS